MEITRVEVKLSPDISEKLDFCVDKLGIKKSGIVKHGINEVYLLVNETYTEAYKKSYVESFSEIYDFELSEGYAPYLAERAAKEFAEYAAVEDAIATVQALFDSWL